MLNTMEARTQLERLHDRHKRFSMDVFDHSSAGEIEKMKEAHKKFKETEKELDTLLITAHGH